MKQSITEIGKKYSVSELSLQTNPKKQITYATVTTTKRRELLKCPLVLAAAAAVATVGDFVQCCGVAGRRKKLRAQKAPQLFSLAKHRRLQRQTDRQTMIRYRYNKRMYNSRNKDIQ